MPAGVADARTPLSTQARVGASVTVANMAFSGAPWRIRRRLPDSLRPAVAAAQAASRGV